MSNPYQPPESGPGDAHAPDPRKVRVRERWALLAVSILYGLPALFILSFAAGFPWGRIVRWLNDLHFHDTTLLP